MIKNDTIVLLRNKLDFRNSGSIIILLLRNN